MNATTASKFRQREYDTCWIVWCTYSVQKCFQTFYRVAIYLFTWTQRQKQQQRQESLPVCATFLICTIRSRFCHPTEKQFCVIREFIIQCDYQSMSRGGRKWQQCVSSKQFSSICSNRVSWSWLLFLLPFLHPLADNRLLENCTCSTCCCCYLDRCFSMRL